MTPASLAAAAKSSLKGSALSLATAGALSKFTIFAMDHYGNLLERAKNIAVIVESEMTSEYHSHTVDSNRAVNAMVFKDMTASYRVTTSGRYRITVAALDAGLSVSMSSRSSTTDAEDSVVYSATTSDVSLQSYYSLGRDFLQRSNATFSEMVF